MAVVKKKAVGIEYQLLESLILAQPSCDSLL
jgi:hypothetical protein